MLGVLGVLVLVLLQPVMFGDEGGLFDYWPMYHGARAWLAAGDAYWNDPSLPSLGTVSAVGNAYPLHSTLMLGLPLAWLAPASAGAVWVLVVGLAWVVSIQWARQSWLWLAWFPMWDALRIQQVSAAVTVASIFALGALDRRNRGVFLVAILVMAAKPQQTIFLILAFIWLARSWWRSMLAAWGAVAALTFAAQPDWLGEWVQKIALRSDVVHGEQWLTLALVPLGLLMVWKGSRASGLAVLSTATAPWPVAGNYVAALWPLGMQRRQFTVMALAGLAAVLAASLLGNYWLIPGGLMVGAALSLLVPGSDNTRPISEVAQN